MFLSFSSCKEHKSTEMNLPEKFLGTWRLELTADDSLNLISSKLFLNTNKTFKYAGINEFNDSIFSNGNWKVVNDTIFFNSSNSKECFHLRNGISYNCENFSESNHDKNIEIKPVVESNTTLKDCIPNNEKIFYAEITDEKILFRNDSLIYVPKKHDCSQYFPDIKLSIYKE